MNHSLTPPQFVCITTKRDALTPDDVAARQMFYSDARGNRGQVRYRFDSITFYVFEFHSDRVEQRLRGLNWLRTMRFFDTREQAEAPGVEAFERGARVSDQLAQQGGSNGGV